MGVLVLSARSCRAWVWGKKRLGKRELGARRNPAEQRDSFVPTPCVANRRPRWARPRPLAQPCRVPEAKVMRMEERVDPGNDMGLFGPESVSWRVLREGSVIIGGLRALLMDAAHPLVVAGARQTGMYERDPWRRLERTLRQTFTVVFGTRLEAELAARRIDDVHGAIKGIDAVTGLRYDARDPELLLWVHACLVSSFLEMERRTLGRLDPAARQRFHEEQMITVEPLRLPRESVPPTVEALDAYIDQVIASGALRRTDDAMAVAALVRDPPDQVPKRWLWRLISFLSFHTLPPARRRLARATPARRPRPREPSIQIRPRRAGKLPRAEGRDLSRSHRPRPPRQRDRQPQRTHPRLVAEQPAPPPASRPRSTTATLPRPARRHSAAVARPITPPPTTSTSQPPLSAPGPGSSPPSSQIGWYDGRGAESSSLHRYIYLSPYRHGGPWWRVSATCARPPSGSTISAQASSSMAHRRFGVAVARKGPARTLPRARSISAPRSP